MILQVHFLVLLILLCELTERKPSFASSVQFSEHQSQNSEAVATQINNSNKLTRNRRQSKYYCASRDINWEFNKGTGGYDSVWKQYLHGNYHLLYRNRGIPYGDVDVYSTFRSYAQIHWIYHFISSVWKYMRDTYGNFGPSSCLYVIIHEGNYPGGRLWYSLNSSNPLQLNILDLGSTKQDSWTLNSARDDETDQITNYLAYFVEYSSKDLLGSPSHNIWKGSSYYHSAWVHIFTYDVYLHLNITDKANRYKHEQQNQSEDYPNPITFWFRDWFLPIYQEYGGTNVLNTYFNLLKKHFPSRDEKYSKDLDMGGFVHFWLAAAGVDLAPLAWKAFGWNVTYDKELIDARIRFSAINSLYNITSEYYTSMTTLQSTTSTRTEEQLVDHTATTTTHYENPTGYFYDTKLTETAKIHESTTESQHASQTEIIIAASSAPAGFCIIVVIIVLVFIRYYKKKLQNLRMEIRCLTNDEVRDFFQGNSNASKTSDQALYLSMPFVKNYEIPKENFILDDNNIIGSGQYGRVIRGFICQPESTELLPVAVKTVKPDVEVSYFKAMLSEAKIMAYLGNHDNIVLLRGTYTANIKNREIYIALDFCTNGDLQNFLKKHAKSFTSGPKKGIKLQALQTGENVTDSGDRISPLDLLRWAHDISKAMVYLTEKNVIHGDMAARNVLLTAHRVAKVSDFGLSRQLLNYTSYMKTSQTPLPWRWMALESLKEMEFSVSSDVWAFGITLWEIFSLGDTPYPGWTWDYTFVDRLVAGDRLQAPPYADDLMFELMQDCWKLKPSERPSFQIICNVLRDLVVKAASENPGEQNYIQLSADLIQAEPVC